MNLTPYPDSIPEGVELITTPEGVTLAVSSRNYIAWFIFLFSLFWTFHVMFIFSLGLIDTAHSRGPHWLILIFLLPFISIGLGFLYFSLCRITNRAYFECTAQDISISNKPLWWPLRIKVPTSDLLDFKVRQSFPNFSPFGGMSHGMSYGMLSLGSRIVYVDSTNHERKLFSGSMNPEQTDYICGYLRHIYRPRPVAGF